MLSSSLSSTVFGSDFNLSLPFVLTELSDCESFFLYETSPSSETVRALSSSNSGERGIFGKQISIDSDSNSLSALEISVAIDSLLSKTSRDWSGLPGFGD